MKIYYIELFVDSIRAKTGVQIAFHSPENVTENIKQLNAQLE